MTSNDETSLSSVSRDVRLRLAGRRRPSPETSFVTGRFSFMSRSVSLSSPNKSTWLIVRLIAFEIIVDFVLFELEEEFDSVRCLPRDEQAFDLEESGLASVCGLVPSAASWREEGLTSIAGSIRCFFSLTSTLPLRALFSTRVSPDFACSLTDLDNALQSGSFAELDFTEESLTGF